MKLQNNFLARVKIALIKITVMERLNISELYNFMYYTRKRLMCFRYNQKYKTTINFKYFIYFNYLFNQFILSFILLWK